MIHSGCPDEIDKELFIQELFFITMGYLVLDYPTNIQIAAVYMLYFLYMTQPLQPKIKIKISTSVFEILLNLRQKIREENIVDAYYILNEMQRIGSFSYCAVVKLDEMQSLLDSESNYMATTEEQQLEPSEFVTMSSEIFDDREELEDLVSEYDSIKSDINHFDPVSFSVNAMGATNPLSLVQQNFVNYVEEMIENHEKTKVARINQFIQEWNDLNKPKKRGPKKKGDEASPATKKKRASAVAAATSSSNNGDDLVPLQVQPPSTKPKPKKKRSRTVEMDSSRTENATLESIVTAFLSGRATDSDQPTVPLLTVPAARSKKNKTTTPETPVEESSDASAAASTKKKKTTKRKATETSDDAEPPAKKKKTKEASTTAKKSRKATTSNDATSSDTTSDKKKKKKKKDDTTVEPKKKRKTKTATTETTTPPPQEVIDVNEDLCYICGDGGLLICCESCPNSCHPTCAGLSDVPEGEWYCTKCTSSQNQT